MDTVFPITFSHTMLSDLWTCEFKWYRAYVQRLTGVARSGDLIAGGLFAKACEITRKAYFNDGQDEEAAIEAGYNHILMGEDTGDSLKTNERVAFIFRQYFKKFRMDSSLIPVQLADGTHAIEYAFQLDTGIAHPEIPDQNIILKGKLDGLYERQYQGRITERYVVDEKTTKTVRRVKGNKAKLIDFNAEEDQYRMDGQFVCLTQDHEVLTYKGWVKINELQKEEPVVCWEEGQLYFDKPYGYIQKEFDGDLISYDGQTSIVGTPEHRQVVLNRKNKRYETYTLSDIPQTFDKYQFIAGGEYKVDEKAVTELHPAFIQLIVATQADGCWIKESLVSNSLTFCFAKRRKITRLKVILEALGCSYTENTRKSDHYSTGQFTEIRVTDKTIKDSLWLYLGKEKNFGSWLLGLPLEKLTLFLTELAEWDGYHISKDRWVYTNTNINNIEWVQTVASLCGYVGNIQENQNQKKNASYSKCYEIYFTNRIHKAVSRHKKEEIPFKGVVYCINVPSSYFLVRYNGRIMVTGNCYHWAARQLGVKTNKSLIRRIPIGVEYEAAFELDIPVTPVMLDRWETSTFSKIHEVIDKYKWLKESGKHASTAFYPVYNKGCTEFAKVCPFHVGCVDPYGEQILASQYQQLIYHEGKMISVKEFRELKGII